MRLKRFSPSNFLAEIKSGGNDYNRLTIYPAPNSPHKLQFQFYKCSLAMPIVFAMSLHNSYRNVKDLAGFINKIRQSEALTLRYGTSLMLLA